MRHEVFPLEVPGAVGVGAARRCDLYSGKCVQIFDPGGPTWSGTIDIEGSLDGSTFSAAIVDITAAGIVNITTAIVFIRIRKKVQTAGVITALLGGFNVRTDGA